jgi:hypothetical protein
MADRLISKWDKWCIKDQHFTRSLHPNMPPSTIAKNRQENVVICLTMATNTLQIIADNFETPFLGAIINTTHAVIENIQVSFSDWTFV